MTSKHVGRRDFSAQSVQRDDYRAPRLSVSQPVSIDRPRLCIPFTATTTSSDYRAYPRETLLTTVVKRTEPVTDHISACPSEIRHDWRSTHRDEFQFRQQPHLEPIKISTKHRLVLPFTGSSTSRADFQAPPAEVLRQSRPSSAGLKSICDQQNIHVEDLLENGKFEGFSSYKSDYQPIPLPVAESPLEYDLSQDRPIRFEGDSEQHSQYRSIDLEKVSRTHTDNKTFISSISNPGSTFDATTEFRDNFKRMNIEKNNDVLEPYIMEPPIPFDATTESRASYRPFILDKPEHIASPPGREVPVFESNSSHRIDYVPYPNQS